MPEDPRIRELREAVVSGRYEVDARAVAEAMLRRPAVSEALAVLVPREVHRPAVPVEEDDPAPGPGLA